MNPQDPQYRTRVIALIAGIVVVFAIIAWRVQGVLSPVQPQDASATGAAANMAVPGPLVASNDEPPEGDIELPQLLAPASIDPFRTVLKKPEPVSTAPAPATRRRPILRPRPFNSTSMPGEGPMAPLPGVINVQPEEKLVLKGLMSGDSGVAIFQQGQNSYVVKKGEKFGDGYVVTDIGTESAVITREKERVTLSVGQ